MTPLLVPLVSKGLDLLANAASKYGESWIKEKTGIDVSEPSLSSEDLLKLKQYEMEHEEELLKLTVEQKQTDLALEQMYLVDVQSAREMQAAALNQSDLFAKRFVYYFATFWSLASCVFIGGVTFFDVPDNNIRFADTILGFLLGTIIATFMNFFFGSSRSSQGKDDIIRTAFERSK